LCDHLQQAKEELELYQEAPYNRTDAPTKKPRTVRIPIDCTLNRIVGFLYVFQTEALNKVFPREVGFPNIEFDNLLCGCSCHYSVNDCFQSRHLDLISTVFTYGFIQFFFYMVSMLNLQQLQKIFLCEVLCSRDKEGKVDLATKETLVSQARLSISEWSRFDLERGC
jgi:hypothetical protein